MVRDGRTGEREGLDLELRGAGVALARRHLHLLGVEASEVELAPAPASWVRCVADRRARWRWRWGGRGLATPGARGDGHWVGRVLLKWGWCWSSCYVVARWPLEAAGSSP